MSEQTTRTRRTQRGKTSEERAAEVETLAAQLNEGCGRVDDVGEVAGDAAGVGPVHRYSANNVLLLWMRIEQRGVTLTRVTGYRAWQAMGRQVVKGARSFAVLAPVRRRLTAAEAAERASAGRAAYDADGRPALVVRGFRLERVFRYEDTEGQHLPEMPEVGYATGDTPDDAWATLAALIAGHGLRLTAEPEPGDARGHTDYGDRIVNVDPSYPLAERVHVLVHELGHIRCGHEQRRGISRAQRETEAESVAFVICTVLGLHIGEVAAVYVGGWTNGDPDTIAAAQAAVHCAAQTVLSDLERQACGRERSGVEGG